MAYVSDRKQKLKVPQTCEVKMKGRKSVDDVTLHRNQTCQKPTLDYDTTSYLAVTFGPTRT